MANTSPTNPSTVVDDANVGSVSWNNPSNAAACDDVYSQSNSINNTNSTHYLKSTGYGFDLPATATIDGIVITVSLLGSVNNMFPTQSMRLVLNNVIQTGTTRTNGSSVNQAEATYTFGSSSDLWGQTLTVSDIENANFGAAYFITHGGGATNRTYSVDCFQITIYYTDQSGPANLKTWNGIPKASVKTINGVAIASVKTWNGVA